jgi:hypothetical protein
MKRKKKSATKKAAMESESEEETLKKLNLGALPCVYMLRLWLRGACLTCLIIDKCLHRKHLNT